MKAGATAGFSANTDFGRFSHFLHRARPPDEVDFWQPLPHGFKAIPPGAPFFFPLCAPHRGIAGFGFFARYERVPVWLGWESFGDKDGTDTGVPQQFRPIVHETWCSTARSRCANHRHALGALVVPERESVAGFNAGAANRARHDR